MNVITDTWRHLLRRRLWPVAVLLVGALAAVPVLLAKSPATPAPAPAPAAETGSGPGLGQSIVTMASDAAGGPANRHVVGARRNPFTPDPRSLATPTPVPTVGAGSTVTTSSTSGAGSGATTTSNPQVPSTPSVTTGGGTTTPTTPSTPTTPTGKHKAPTPWAITVNFGDATTTTALPRMHVKRLDALPSSDQPTLIYLGHESGHPHVALFLVDTGVSIDGDGQCRPYATDCEKLALREGGTEFFTVKDPTTGTVTAQYELDLLHINVPAHASSSKARNSRAAKARAAGAGVAMARVVRVLKP